MKILVVIVDYNSAKFTEKLISSFPKDISFEFLIACTGNRLFQADREDVTVRKLENIGYFPAARLVIDDIDISKYNFVIISNSDIEIVSFPLNILKDLEEKKSIGLVGPSIVNLMGEQQNPFLVTRLSFSRRLFWNVYYKSYLLSLVIAWLRKKLVIKKVSREPLKSQAVYAVHGAFMIFTNSFFEKGCKIKDDFFLYAEEISSAEECRKVELGVQTVPKLKVIHKENISTKGLNSRSKWLIQRDSYRTLIKNYFI